MYDLRKTFKLLIIMMIIAACVTPAHAESLILPVQVDAVDLECDLYPSDLSDAKDEIHRYVLRFAASENRIPEDVFPKRYKDETLELTITREWYMDRAWVYAAHIVMSDYGRLYTEGGGGPTGTEKPSAAAERLSALLVTNGSWQVIPQGNAIVRGGKIYLDRKCNTPACYSNKTGLLFYADDGSEYEGIMISELVSKGIVTDTFNFNPAFLIDGEILVAESSEGAQRTFIGTNGKPGDIWLCCSEGRNADGESIGITNYMSALYLKQHGCTFGVGLDGGGSTNMVYRGQTLIRGIEHTGERRVGDFVCVSYPADYA